MSELARILPAEAAIAAVPEIQILHLGLSDIKEIVRHKPLAMHEMGLATWHAALSTGRFNLNPMMLSAHVDSSDPNLLRHVSRALNQKVLFDLCYSYGIIPGQDLEEPALQVTTAHLFPNRLHIADVKLLDPRKPVENASQKDDQSHESLHLFGELLINARAAARAIKAEKMTLTASHSELLPVFTAHGFEVENSEMGRMAAKFGLGIPMELLL
ncbi:hypothetical protein FAZ78_16940 [Cereibacter changlensis]|uniref:Uncharacterized protein n=1 Tax=Cereibacter changlensis TaxID=402884 RepID=A0A4U0YZI9_9RHOB|nr:hypothetical protein [Cereibacter changlensis]TKA95421.1 hypothetical protein FAZ78_16940 [Cereibacter changlensis]